MKLLIYDEILKKAFFLILLTIYPALCSEFWIGADFGINFTKFTELNLLGSYKAKSTPGFNGGINFIHKPLNMFAIRYHVVYNQIRPVIADTLGGKETVIDSNGNIIETGRIVYNSQKYSLSTIGGYIIPSFCFFLPHKRVGASIGLGIGALYHLNLKHYNENFGSPIEEKVYKNYNKFDIPIVGSIDFLFKIKETLIFSLNNGFHAGTQKLDEEQTDTVFKYPAYRMIRYQMTLSLNSVISGK